MRGFLPALHSVKGALGVLVYFTVLAQLDSDEYLGTRVREENPVLVA